MLEQESWIQVILHVCQGSYLCSSVLLPEPSFPRFLVSLSKGSFFHICRIRVPFSLFSTIPPKRRRPSMPCLPQNSNQVAIPECWAPSSSIMKHSSQTFHHPRYDCNPVPKAFLISLTRDLSPPRWPVQRSLNLHWGDGSGRYTMWCLLPSIGGQQACTDGVPRVDCPFGSPASGSSIQHLTQGVGLILLNIIEDIKGTQLHNFCSIM